MNEQNLSLLSEIFDIMKGKESAAKNQPKHPLKSDSPEPPTKREPKPETEDKLDPALDDADLKPKSKKD